MVWVLSFFPLAFPAPGPELSATARQRGSPADVPGGETAPAARLKQAPEWWRTSTGYFGVGVLFYYYFILFLNKNKSLLQLTEVSAGRTQGVQEVRAKLLAALGRALAPQHCRRWLWSEPSWELRCCGAQPPPPQPHQGLPKSFPPPPPHSSLRLKPCCSTPGAHSKS